MTTVSKHTSMVDRFIKCYENTYDIKQLPAFKTVYTPLENMQICNNRTNI